MNNTRVLIFPLDIDDADIFIRSARALSVEVVGASSAMTNPGGKDVDHFIRLPFVTDTNFDQALQHALKLNSVSAVYSPHQGVWRHLENLLEEKPEQFHFHLCTPDPFSANQRRFSIHEEWATSVSDPAALGGFSDTYDIRPPLPHVFYSALHRQFLDIPGDSDVVKLRALCDIARLLPEGDLVEVGSLYGRSAFALGCLAGRYKLGGLVCVDPWNAGLLNDQGSKAAILNAEVKKAEMDLEKIFRIFLNAVALVGNVGYIRKTSEAAIVDYQAAIQHGELHSHELGYIPVTGRLSLIHIDANHSYDHVRRDVDLWSPYLQTGGWVLLDDYVWAFGDGPRQVGDALLSSPLYDSAFVSGDTLFLRRTGVGK